MSEFKGTKGPWRVSEMHGDTIDIRHDNNEAGAMSLTLARAVARQTWIKEAECNARLIASAPELLEALQDALHAHDKHSEHSEWDFAREVIAKALGQ